ncbi:hypothetical protein [Marinagarivorans algicola]|uniref:hypothetical protein n=1 Tax=Marinagarivorans algicola TaxID=1513270 RepID=UPI0006B68A87|nr:hypothetical protein [Marinagarivorans algicola]
MSSVVVIIVIIALLASLVCYAFISQTLAHKREQRDRLIGALSLKARNFKFMLSGFPQGFLPPELSMLVQKSLMEIYNQLTELEPENNGHQNELQALSQQMNDARRQNTRQGSVSLENPQQISEVKACLEELHKYIHQLEEKDRIPAQTGDAHRASIRELVVGLTVDSYTIAGKQALDKDKPRLALHNLELALHLMERERQSGHFGPRITDLQTQCAALAKRIADEDDESTAPEAQPETQEGLEGEWDEYANKGGEWKKKQMYD